MGDTTHINESRHTHQRVTSHTSTSHITHINGSHHNYEDSRRLSNTNHECNLFFLERPLFNSTSPNIPSKRALHATKRALHAINRALHATKRASLSKSGAILTWSWFSKAKYSIRGALHSIKKSPTCHQKSPPVKVAGNIDVVLVFKSFTSHQKEPYIPSKRVLHATK